MKYAEVLLTRKVGDDMDSLTYEVPEELDIKHGQGVKVPLRGRSVYGIVLSTHNKKPKFRTQKIKEITNPIPLLKETQITLLKWISDYYFCPKHKTLRLLITPRMVENKPFRKNKKTDQESSKKIVHKSEKKLTPDQEKVVKTILTSTKKSHLIHGITGSGKTEVYVHLAKEMISKNKQVILLVPEISLTPQMIEYFENALQIKTAVIHSKLSEGERYRAWTDIWTGEAKLVLGSRSAIFAPTKELGLIIIDEEHETSYKQDQAPRYNAHKVAEKLIKLNKSAKLVLGSATPSIESTERLKDTTLRLHERIGASILPEIEIVDLRDEFHKKNFSIFSDRLREELTTVLNKKEQAILFLNRRGAASSIVCRDCGYIEKCPTCDIPFTYHKSTLSSPSLICHHCGLIGKMNETCPNCNGINIRFLGIGTQKIEADIQREFAASFPKLRVLRADKDTTSTKHGFEDIYRAFRNHEADILIGTQMVAKGLHLPKVNLVGVVLADIGLNIPDFRTSERNFQLLTQVSGRAGRSGKDGKVIIQTYNPDNLALRFAAAADTEGFEKYEITQRKLLSNPPFSSLAKLLVSDKSQKMCKEKAEKLEDQIWKIVREEGYKDEIDINTYPAYLLRLHGKYRFITLIKDRTNSGIIHKILEKLPKEYIMDSSIKIDIDPIAIT